MYILRVAPLTTIPLPHEQVLDYFFRESLPAGALVEMVLNRRRVLGVVFASAPLAAVKGAVRKSVRYTLRAVSRVVSPAPVLAGTQLELARWVAKYYWAPLGHALKTVLPQAILKSPLAIGRERRAVNAQGATPRLIWKADRRADYRRLIKSALRGGRQVLFIVPDQAAEIHWRAWLEREHIAHATYSSSIRTKASRALWQRLAAGEAVVVLGTRSAEFLPFANLGLVVVDEEDSSAYKSWEQSPRYDTREVAEKLAELSKSQLVFGALSPTSTAMLRAKRGRVTLTGPDAVAGRLLNPTVVDLKLERRAGNESPLSRSLQERVSQALAEKRPVLLFINRRGTAPVVLCRDCGAVIECPRCSVAMVQHRGAVRATKAAVNVLVCHHCNTRLAVPDVCPRCHGHELHAFGAGTERIEAEVKKLWPAARATRLDTDASPTSREVGAVIQSWRAGDVDILVATQLALALRYHIFSRPPLLGIVALDPLMAFPDYRVGERLWQLIRALGLAACEVVVQTYAPEQPLLEALKSSPEAFYAAELAERRTLGLPPFSELIKLTFRHRDSAKAAAEAANGAQQLSAVIAKAKVEDRVQILGPVPAFIAKEKGQYVWSVLVQSRLTSLKARNTLLRFVPSNWNVDVHPDSIL
ncbi:primosomal protein N' [Candidatus Parcubacteria bacterium]|nr:primosomal protein N' [Candidatus Parcubacteria bacterium]